MSNNYDNKLVVKESTKSGLKVCFGTVPIIGPMLDEIIFNAPSRIRQEKLNKFIVSLMESMHKISEDEIDNNYIKNDNFALVFESIIHKVHLADSDEKIERYKNILLNDIKNNYQSDFKETFLDIVSKINEEEIIILNECRMLNLKNYSIYAEKKLPEHLLEKYNLEHSLSKFYIQDLISKSLLYDDGMGRWGGERPFNMIKITEFGIEFLNFVEGYE